MSSINESGILSTGVSDDAYVDARTRAGATTTKTSVTTTDATTAAGISGADGAVPDAVQQALTGSAPVLGAMVALTFQALMQSVDNKLPAFASEDTSVLVSQVAAALDESQKDVLEKDIKNKAANQRNEVKENGKRLEEALKAQEKAKSKSGIAGLFSKIASYLAGALVAAVGAALIATGAGAVAGGVLIAVGAMMIADQATKDGTGKSIGGQIGGQWGELGFSLALAAVATVASAGAAGAATAGSTAARIGATTAVVTGAIEASKTGVSLDANLAQADAKKTQAKAKEFEAQMLTSQAFTDLAMQLLMNVTKRIASVLDAGADVLQDRGTTLSRTKLTA